MVPGGASLCGWCQKGVLRWEIGGSSEIPRVYGIMDQLSKYPVK